MKKEIANFSFDTPSVNVSIDYAICSVTSILFNDEELIEKSIPLFKIKFRNHDATHFYKSSFDFTYKGFVNGAAKYVNDYAEVLITISRIDSGLKFGIEVKNMTSILLEQAEIMSIGLYPKLEDEGGRGEVDIPYNEGARITSTSRRDATGLRYCDVEYPSGSAYYMYPNMVSSPFMSYICHKKGIYLGMHDKSFTPKHIDFHTVDGSIQTVMSVFTNCNYGENYTMNFDSVMTFFEGDYFDACEIYRKWFYENKPNDLKTIKEKYDEFPKWYHESPVVVTYPIVGSNDSDTEMKEGGFYPYTNALPVIKKYSEDMDSHIMTVLMQWESTAPWAPPYVWPPYGDVDNFYKFRDELHRDGNYLGVYTSGFGWTNVSHRRKYDKTEEFEKNNLKEIMCSDSDGRIQSTIVTDIRFGYDICPKLEKSKQIFIDEAKKMTDAGLDYIQILDQNHGGNPYFCYSEKHGHVPAPGSWQIEETKKILNKIDKTHCLLGCESAASEPYIADLSFSDNRFPLIYHIGEAIPMYSYIYHEFVNNFMGNQVCNTLGNARYSYTYRLAYSFICGDMSTLIIDGNGKLHLTWGTDTIIDDEMPKMFIRNINKWRIGKFMDFLHLGKMVKPMKYQCGKKPIESIMYKCTLHLPSILSSAFTNGNETYQFFVNYDSVDEEISFDDEIKEIIVSSDGKTKKVNSKKITIPKLSVIAILLG